MKAVSRQTTFDGTRTVAVAVEEANDPVEKVVGKNRGSPMAGINFTTNCVGTGTFVAVSVTGISLADVDGNTISGEACAPVGVAGTVVPPTVLIMSVGKFTSAGVLAGATGPKVLETDADGSVVATEQVVHSTRTRPG